MKILTALGVCGVSPRQPRFGEGSATKKKVGTFFLTINNRAANYTSNPSAKSSEMAEYVEKAKKRKRNTDGSTKPSKRVAIEEDKEIRISLSEADQWAPVVGMFAELHFLY